MNKFICIVVLLSVIIDSIHNENEDIKYVYQHISFICTNQKLVNEHQLFTSGIDRIDPVGEYYFAIINKIIAITMENFFNKTDSQIYREYIELKKEKKEKNISCPKISNIDTIVQDLKLENLGLTDIEKDFLEFYHQVKIFSEEKYKKEKKMINENEEKLSNEKEQKKSIFEMTWGEAFHKYKFKFLAFSILIVYFIYSAYFRKSDRSLLKPKNEILHGESSKEEKANPVEEKEELNSEPTSSTANTSKHKVN